MEKESPNQIVTFENYKGNQGCQIEGYFSCMQLIFAGFKHFSSNVIILTLGKYSGGYIHGLGDKESHDAI